MASIRKEQPLGIRDRPYFSILGWGLSLLFLIGPLRRRDKDRQAREVFVR
jgi:hypothetical protein